MIEDMVTDIKFYARYFKSADVFNSLGNIEVKLIFDDENKATILYGGNSPDIIGELLVNVADHKDLNALEIVAEASKMLGQVIRNKKKVKVIYGTPSV